MEPPFQKHSETSQQAAESVKPAAANLRQKVFDYISEQGRKGATDEEMHTALSMNPSTQRPRRIELLEEERIADSGRTRKTESERLAVVWVLPKFSTGKTRHDTLFLNKLKKLGFSSYEKYLQSAHWKNFKYEYFSNHLYECSITRQNVDVVLHHISYANLGKETEADVIPVSKDLHELIHKLNNDHNIPLKHCHKVLDTIIHGLAAA